MSKIKIKKKEMENWLNQFLDILEAQISTLSDLDNVANVDSKVIKNIYKLIGNIQSLYNIMDKNKLDKDVFLRYIKLRDVYVEFYKNNKNRVSRKLHYEINELRGNYDELTESYIANPEDSLHDVQDFTDSYLDFRDQIEYIFSAINVLNQESDFDWLERIKNKVDVVDKELQIILPSILSSFKAEGVKYVWIPEQSITSWWRKMESDMLSC